MNPDDLFDRRDGAPRGAPRRTRAEELDDAVAEADATEVARLRHDRRLRRVVEDDLTSGATRTP